MRVPRDSDRVKGALQDSIIAHILGPSASREVMTTPLSIEQIRRARALQCTETFEMFPYAVVKGEPENKSVMTYAWLQDRVDEKFRTEWLDASWLSLVPETYGVNVAVWEPTGKGQEVQLYKKIMWGLFLFDKKIKHDEEGHLWVHLLYRSGSSWRARVEVQGSGGTSRHNHFDCLELGAQFGAAFNDTISVARHGGGGGGREGGGGDISPPPSPVPGKKRGAAGSAEGTAPKPRTSTNKSQPEDDRGPQAQSKRKPAAKSEGGSKRRKGVTGVGKRKSGGRGAAGSTRDTNYDSDGSIGGDMDWTHQGNRGALPSLTKSQQLLRRKLGQIPEPEYKKAFRRTSLMKAKAEKVGFVKCAVLPCYFLILLLFHVRVRALCVAVYILSIYIFCLRVALMFSFGRGGCDRGSCFSWSSDM